MTASQASRMVVAVVIARLLSPHDYGLAGMVLVFSGIAFIFSDIGMGSGLIQRAVVNEDDRSTVFWTSAGVGVALAVGCMLLAGPIAAFYGEPAVQPLLIVFSLSFVLGSMSVTHAALLQRDMNFRGLEVRNMAGIAVSSVVGVSAALSGLGAWALIAQQLAFSATSTVLLWRFSRWSPRFRFSRTSLRELAGFGMKLFGSRLLFYLNSNAGNIIVGRFLGASALGVYSLAYNIMLLPLGRVIAPLQQTLFPALARMQEDLERIARVWLRVSRVVMAAIAPAMVGLIVVAPDFVPVVLGERWQRVTPVLQILAAVAVLQSLGGLCTSILTAVGKAGTLLRIAIVATTLQLTAFGVGLTWGIIGVAACYAVANLIIVPFALYLVSRTLQMKLRTYFQNLIRIGEIVALMFIATLLIRLVLVELDVPPLARLACVIPCGVAIYLPLCVWRAPEVVAELRQLRPRLGTPAAQST